MDNDTGIEFISVNINQCNNRIFCQYYKPSHNVSIIDSSLSTVTLKEWEGILGRSEAKLPYCYCQSSYSENQKEEDNIYLTLFKDYNRGRLNLNDSEKFKTFSLKDIPVGAAILCPSIDDYPLETTEKIEGKNVFEIKVYDFNTFYEKGNVYFSEIKPITH